MDNPARSAAVPDPLRARAREAAAHARAPYSGRADGAALLLSDGQWVPGVRVESASYPLTIPALLGAYVTAVAGGRRDVRAVALNGPLLSGEAAWFADALGLEPVAEALDGEARALAEVLAGVYRLVELAEDHQADVEGPDPVAEPDRGRISASLNRAVDNAFDDLSRLTGVDARAAEGVPGGVNTREVVTRWDGADPDEVYASVEHLSIPDRRILALAEPGAVGRTYGVPWALRARANAISVRRALHREQLAGTPWSPRIGRLETMARRDGRRRRSFVSFSPHRGGRMIEVVGRIGPGTEAVAVYVPGTGTNLDMSHVNTEVATDLVDAGGGRVAVVAFLDGEFPQDIMADAGRPRFAETIAPRLVRFCREVDRLMEIECPGAELTVVGHSYGGRIVGTAERLGLRADRVVYAESPDLGVGVDGPSDWRSPGPVRRFSMTAPGDPVELLDWM